jgi:hypothetical protein
MLPEVFHALKVQEIEVGESTDNSEKVTEFVELEEKQ